MLIMKTFFLTGIAALSITGQSIAQDRVFEEPYWTQKPVIEAMGRAHLEVPPNRASFSVEFRETSTRSEEAMQLAVERARIAYETVKKVAGDASRITSSVTVEPYYKQYRERDGGRVENTRADKVDGYAAKVSLSVTMLDVDKSGAARAALLALGPEQSSRLRVYLERTAKINRQAYEAAVEDASLRAKASAKAAGATLGNLMVLQEGNGPCLGQWTSQPGRVTKQYMNRNRTMAAPPMESDMVTSTQMRNGKTITITQADIDALNLPSDRVPQTVTASVCAVYAIAP